MKNMKKKLKIIGLFIIVFLYQSVFAKEVQVFFIAEGGNTNTNGFKIIDDYLQKTDGTYCATYSSSEKIINLNSINGKKFTIFKNGTNLVKGREWYTYNYSNNKLYYFNQNNSYNVTDILQKLSLGSDPYLVISLFITAFVGFWEWHPCDTSIVIPSMPMPQIEISAVRNIYFMFTTLPIR